ncbi:TlpA disulfide reductase family protein [Sphingobacterium faecale]|uniref:Redoxin domain-containing protein n=1 Tax=Sphingobacterium faecale TaxID=2803775 RepID=A0ABS1R4D7_9SPHI|nr:TlpA disulfide reductase family protein [Sphingobacterium faecale]MBL1408877.1 redoxin domain-containing protein [Sphingobacterium faecale]
MLLVLSVLGVRAQHNYEIVGYLESGSSSDSIYLQVYDKVPKILQHTKVENRRFVLKGTTEVPRQVTIKVKGWRRSQELYVEPAGKYSIQLNEDWKLHNEVIGGQENAIRKAYENDSRLLLDTLQILGQEYEKATDDEKIDLNEKMTLVNQRWDSIKRAYIQAYPHSLAILDVMRPQLEVMSFEQLEELLNLFSDNLAYASTYQHLLDRYKEKKDERLVGTEAPSIVAKTVTGENFNLSQLRGKLVLLDFWASWCAPCRVGNKNLKPIYAQYKHKGFEIVSFSMDDKEKLWKDAIEKDGIPWIHISDLSGLKDSRTAQDYHIRSLPTIYLIDTDGRVIAQNIDKEELVGILEAKLR